MPSNDQNEPLTTELSNTDVKLLNLVQKDVPLCSDPFAAVAKKLFLDKDWVIDRLIELEKKHVISRFAAIKQRKKSSVSTLAAFKIPEERINDVAHLINSYDEVSHNHLREHEYNMWFVVQDKSAKKVESLLYDLSNHIDFPLLNLPILESYHSDMVIKLGEDCSCKDKKPDAVTKSKTVGRKLK